MRTSKGGKQPKSIQLQDRDFAMLCGLFECRIMTLAHVAAIYFEGRKEYTKKRLQKLKQVGLVGERPRRVNEPSILFLAKNGLLLLRERGMLARYPTFSIPALLRRANVSDRTIRHELAVMDVKTAFHIALRGSAIFSIAEFGTWPRLYEFAARHPIKGMMNVKPDGFIRIQEKSEGGPTIEHVFFVEVDRSTEMLDIITSRASSYLDYFRSGGFAMKKGAARDEYRRYPFRVLIVCKSEARRDNIATQLITRNLPIRTMTYLATSEDVKVNALGEAWVIPLDYREPANKSMIRKHRLIEPY